MARDSDSDYAFRLQMQEALAASLSSSRSRSPHLRGHRPPSPPIVARTGLAIVVEEDDRNSSRPKREPEGLRFDFRKAIGEGNSKGKGKIIHENAAATSVVRNNPNFQNSSGSSKANFVVNGKFSGNVMYRLYFKGLVSEEIWKGKGKMTDLVVAGFGVAICDQRDNLLFEMKGPLVDPGLNRQGAEIKALTNGLAEALKLGIKHITFCCDAFPIFQFVTGKWMPKQKKISMLMDDLQRIRQQFSLSQPNLVAGNEIKFAYKLARESIVSQVTPPAKASRKEECVICYNDIDAERMFSVDRCRHRFCFQCVKQHVEVKLLHGMDPKCPHDGCKSELVIDACGKLLTTKLNELWRQRIKENSVPVTERVYCPYPKCSALMSKTKISESADGLMSVYPKSAVRRCVECRGLFCVDCKVPWHGQMSCSEYKKLHPNPPADDVKLKSLADNKLWRQCGKCQHMIELTYGCNHITCRCGYEFCYNCGGGWNKKKMSCNKRCPGWNEAYIMHQHPEARAYMAPNIHFGAHMAPNNHFGAYVAPNNPFGAYVAPNNHFDDDDHDDDDDEDDEDDDEFDYNDFDYNDFDNNFNGYRRHFGNGMNIPFGNHMNGSDPFFDLPDGVLFTPDMLSPRSRRQFDLSDDSDDMDYPPVHTHTVPANAPASREGQSGEMGQSHLSHTHVPSGNAATVNAPLPNQQDTRNVHPRHDTNVFDPFFDLPDGVLFTPDMLSPRSRRRFELSDDDSDDLDVPAMRTHTVPANAPATVNAPSGDAATVNAPHTNHQDQYFGMYPGGDFMAGEFGDFYDSDEDDFEYDDYTDPFHPDYNQFF